MHFNSRFSGYADRWRGGREVFVPFGRGSARSVRGHISSRYSDGVAADNNRRGRSEPEGVAPQLDKSGNPERKYQVSQLSISIYES